ncbi:hypothetical protein V5O48_006157 [Marasmius crinis-equi]|uniref:Cytochrome P450 n=1 Tax=Marasmius crinis-equi TaxID=585013 RepID=A0ABR3FKG9_9AGAR
MVPSLINSDFAVLFAVVLGGAYLWATSRRPARRYFPGPKGLPLIGNLGQIPTKHTWRYWEKLSKIHGPIVRLTLNRDEILILNDPKDAEELLGRRSHNYSSRPPLVYAGKYQSANKRMLLTPYGKTLKRQRAFFAQMIQPRTVGGYEGIQETEATKLLHNMMADPTNATRHSRRFAASLVFHLSYGGRLKDDDNDLEAVTRILHDFVREAFPGAHIVDSFPWLDDILPEILAPWRKEATERHKYAMSVYQRLALEVKSQMENDEAGVECFTARVWEEVKAQGKTEVDLEELAYLPGTAFEAGTDTSTGIMQWFVMAMLLYPDTLHKAQAELDSVVGADGETMPGFAHFSRLPYCCALVKEVLRWAPPAPGAFPHSSDHDDEYKGCFIPAKTIVIASIWSMHHNEEIFPDSYTFKPERFVNADKLEVDPNDLLEGHYTFGFGRRKCPGMHLGGKSMWIGIVRMLWAFDIEYARDVDGKPIPVDPENCTPGMTSKPNDFPHIVSARSATHKRTVLNTFAITK